MIDSLEEGRWDGVFVFLVRFTLSLAVAFFLFPGLRSSPIIGLPFASFSFIILPIDPIVGWTLTCLIILYLSEWDKGLPKRLGLSLDH
jgi:hypothetical protein